MGTVSVKLDDLTVRVMDCCVKAQKYSTRSDFVRAAILDKAGTLSRDELVEEFMKFRGRAKKKHSDAQWRRHHEQFSKELLAEHTRRFNLPPLDP